MPRVDIKQDEDNDDNHEQAAEGNEECGGMANGEWKWQTPSWTETSAANWNATKGFGFNARDTSVAETTAAWQLTGRCSLEHAAWSLQPRRLPASSAAARFALLGGTGVVTAATVIRLDLKTVAASTTAASAAATESVDCIPDSLLQRICNWAFRKLIQFMLILWQIANEKWRRLPRRCLSGNASECKTTAQLKWQEKILA